MYYYPHFNSILHMKCLVHVYAVVDILVANILKLPKAANREPAVLHHWLHELFIASSALFFADRPHCPHSFYLFPVFQGHLRCHILCETC